MSSNTTEAGPKKESAIQSIEWKGDHVRLIDQTLLPQRVEYLRIESAEQIREAIQNLRIRGAPAIGIAAAYGLYLGIRDLSADNFDDFWSHVEEITDYLSSARPTAVNLNWALDQLKDTIQAHRDKPVPIIKEAVLDRAMEIHEEDKQICKRIGQYGIELISQDAQLMTHCNTGSLATGQYGTALSVIYHAFQADKNPHIWVNETRPLLQGARLTTWELMQAGIPLSLITDSTAGSIMQDGRVDAVITGTDRVAANGDVANKIGTYSLAVLAHEHEIPFYVAAPLSSIDLEVSSGDEIPIEERGAEELTRIGEQPVAPENVNTYTPAFDVTPHHYVSAFITEKGIITEDFESNFRKLKES